MYKSLSILFLFLLLIGTSGFAQETMTNSEAQVSITLPAGWVYEADGNDLIASPADGGFEIHLTIMNAEDVDAALAGVDDMLQSQVENLELGEGELVDVNGMPGIFVEGTADGVLILVGVIDTPVEGVCLMVGAWGDPEVVEQYADIIYEIFSSISPAN
jgi:hypothetical protein